VTLRKIDRLEMDCIDFFIFCDVPYCRSSQGGSQLGKAAVSGSGGIAGMHSCQRG